MLKVTVDSYEHAKDLEDSPQRFNGIRRLFGDISIAFTKKLRDLERDGYIRRTVYPVRPAKVEYELTALGRSVLEPIKAFLNWTLKAFPDIKHAREVFDRAHKRPVANGNL